ncbi:MAG: magnesium transporter [Xenococcaceae cyanobacterium MO_188.B32]|nr:magnesium transporter [Xenococcaceae cyanobacterium MO_188.B32]
MTEARPPSKSNLNSRQELRQLVGSELKILLEQENWSGAKAILVPVQSADIAEAISGLPKAMQALAFRLLAKDEAIAVYENLDSSVQQVLLQDFSREDVRNIIEQMSPDDRVKLFDELPAKVVRQLLVQLSPSEREATALLLGYQPQTAGRIMTPEYLSLKERWTVAQAFEHIRRLAPTKETIYSLYVTDNRHCLTGSLSLRDLVIAQPEQIIGEIAEPHVICVHTDTHQEEVARLLKRYDFLALPVVDSENRLVGIITIDDALDILETETTKDIHTLGGVQPGNSHYFQSNIVSIVNRRAFWLITAFLITTLASLIVKTQEQLLRQAIVLVAFIPLLIDTGGDVGCQSSTVVIRGLNTQNLRRHRVFWIIQREAMAGALLGLILGLGAVAWAYLLQGNLLIAVVVGISLFLISTLASGFGAALPFLFSRLGLDPALMSAPFLTTVADVFGVFIYLYVAQWILLF